MKRNAFVRGRQLCGLLALVLLLMTPVHGGTTGDNAEKDHPGFIAGTITVRGGGSMTGGRIMFYDVESGIPPAPEHYDRAPDVALEIGVDGKFNAELAPGNYYLAAIKRVSGEQAGHPKGADIIYRKVDAAGNPHIYAVKSGATLDIGTVEAVPLSASNSEALFGNRIVETAVKGIVKSEDGKSVENAVVVAFLHFAPREGGKPLFLSDKTGKDGLFVLRVTEGTYFLVSRTGSAGGPPSKGQLIGYYGGKQPEPLPIARGEIKSAITITLKPFIGEGTFPKELPK